MRTKLMLALALIATAALLPARADGPNCPRSPAEQTEQPKAPTKAPTTAEKTEKKEGLRRWKLEAL